jgi:hypothetical protein
MNPSRTKKGFGLGSAAAPAALATPGQLTASAALPGGSPGTGARRCRVRNLFEPVAKPFDGCADPVRRLVAGKWRSRVWAGVTLATVIAHGLMAAAQDTNGPAQTNGPSASNAVTQTAGTVQTNGPTATNSLAQTNDLAATTGPAPTNSAAQPASPARPDYSAFKIIADRNIFDPNRSPRRRGGGPPTKPKVTEYFSLVGTLSYEKGTFAFFDGTSSEYRKALKPADAIAGYKVTNIAADVVQLASGTNQLELHVGMQMRREDEGEWLLAGQSQVYASASTASSAASPAGSGGDEDEVLKRLRQKREQELSK